MTVPFQHFRRNVRIVMQTVNNPGHAAGQGRPRKRNAVAHRIAHTYFHRYLCLFGQLDKSVYKRNNKAAGQISQSIAEINAKILMLDQLRSKGYLAPEVHQAQTIELRNQLSRLKTERNDLFETRILGMLEAVKKLKDLVEEIEEPLEVFDERLLMEAVEDITINRHDEMTVTLLGGLKFKELL